MARAAGLQRADAEADACRILIRPMNPTPALGLPAAIEAAVQRVKSAAHGAAERAVDSLGVSALASANVFQRDDLLGAQFELNRKLAMFFASFDETLDRRVEREVLPRNSAPACAGRDQLGCAEPRGQSRNGSPGQRRTPGHAARPGLRNRTARTGQLRRIDAARQRRAAAQPVAPRGHRQCPDPRRRPRDRTRRTAQGADDRTWPFTGAIDVARPMP